MTRSAIQTIAIVALLGVLVFSAGHIRLSNFERSRPDLTIDEDLFMHLGFYLTQNVFQYHTIPYAQKLRREGRIVPGYILSPVFKHPPLYPYLISLSYRIFGAQGTAAIIPSLLFGVLLIPLGYWLGALAFDRRVGLVAAALMFCDPVQIICSQKIWMETTLSFWTVLAVALFLYGRKHQRSGLYIVSGLAAGLAALTKYPGILPTLGIAGYALLFEPSLFLNKKFVAGLLAPFVLFVPWLVWNLRVLGGAFFLGLIEDHGLMSRWPWVLGLFVAVGGMVLFFTQKRVRAGMLAFRKRREMSARERSCCRVPWLGFLCLGIGIVFFGSLTGAIAKNLNPSSIPATSWAPGLFSGENVLFYFRKLTEYSLVYAMAFGAFFVPRQKNPALTLLKIISGALLAFYALYGNYQSRYILAATPFLIVLGTQAWFSCYHALAAKARPWRLLGRLALLFLAGHILWKTHWINTAVSFGNDMCYF